MNRDGVGDFCRADDRGHVEIAFFRRRRSDAHGLISEQHVLLIEVRSGVDRYRLDSKFAARTQNAQGNFAAVRDDYFFEHTICSLAGGWRLEAGAKAEERCLALAPASTPQSPAIE